MSAVKADNSGEGYRTLLRRCQAAGGCYHQCCQRKSCSWPGH